MKRAFIVVLLLSAITMPASVHACSCVCENRGVKDPKDMEQEAKAVFVGTVLEIRDSTEEERHHHADAAVARIRVERFWKGVKTEEVLVSDMGILLPGCCNISFKVGRKYLVYAVGRNMTPGCTRTDFVENAADDLRALGPGKTSSK
jgi:hypothetical protein